MSPFTQDTAQAGAAAAGGTALADAPEAHAIFREAERTDDMAAMQALVKRWQKRYTHLVVIGAGGSGMSARALMHLRDGLSPLSAPPHLHVLDNLDGFSLERFLRRLPRRKCCFLAVSKSGGTLQTLAITERIIGWLGGRGIRRRFAAIAMEGNNPLRALAGKHDMPVFTHDPDLCGRFSIFSAVGMIPALWLGLNAESIRAGGHAVLAHKDEAAEGAALHAAHIAKGRNIAGLLTYDERLWGLALWWRQGWAESLGKQGKGSLPAPALGPLDQHSQLQRWLDGPDDTFFTLLATPAADGRLGVLAAAEARATRETLIARSRPLRTLTLERVDEFTLGALLMHFTLEILFTAQLLGVNPYDQPAVEDGKRRVKEYLAQ